MSLTIDRKQGLVGQVLGDRYEVVRKVARGGMATVYVANDLRLSREVAIKVMNEGLGDSEDFAERFDAEARAAAHLSHPNVVSVFDQGNEDGRPWIVMEYVEGFTLRQVITREAPMAPARALQLFEPVVAAIAAAHRAGMIHRDIKPENVLISVRGQVKVADFGLARAVSTQSHAGTAGLVMGTVSYIAPELITQGHADARSDVYSLGILLYEMLTGRKPHTGESPIQVAYSHVHNPVRPPSLEVSSRWSDEGAIPPYVDALVTTAASQDRAARPRDAGVLLEHLRAARSALGRGVLDDPQLTALMRRTEPQPVSSATIAVPTLPAPRGSDRRFTPVTPVSPSFHYSVDGAPFYSDGPSPYSPRSPHTRTVPTLPGSRATPAPAGATATRRRPGPLWGRVASVLAAIALVAALVWGGWYLAEGRWTTMPALATMTQADAQVEAARAELGITFESEFSEDVPAGRVIRTDPPSGERALRDETVTAWVSKGPERFSVPSLVGRPRADAEASLRDASLQAGTVRETFSDKVPAGSVVSQGTRAGASVRRDTAVDFVVSKGPAPVTVRDFTGRQLVEMQRWASQNGLTVTTASQQNHDTVPAGAVISQDPSNGTVPRGATVSVVVSQGPDSVQVPTGLRGRRADEAAQQVRDAGLEPVIESAVSGGFGLVFGVSPAEGSMVPRGSTVTLRLV